MLEQAIWLLPVSLVSVWIYVQDRKSFGVYWYSFVLLAMLLGTMHFLNVGYSEFMAHVGTNMVIILLLLNSIMLYVFIREHRVTNPFHNYLGLGDVFFMIGIALGLDPLGFTGFLVAGCLTVLIVYAIKRKLHPKPENRIPLAGELALLLIPFLGLKEFGITFNQLILF